MAQDNEIHAPKLNLILGGRRSGKSQYGESLSQNYVKNRTYIATAQAFDQEFARRIEQHKLRRERDWQLLEAPIELTKTLENTDRPNHFILVDCLTLWLTNLILGEHNIDAAFHSLIDMLDNRKGTITLISNEVGLSITPDNKLSREFADHNGILNQKLASIASDVFLIAAGLPLRLK